MLRADAGCHLRVRLSNSPMSQSSGMFVPSGVLFLVGEPPHCAQSRGPTRATGVAFSLFAVRPAATAAATSNPNARTSRAMPDLLSFVHDGEQVRLVGDIEHVVGHDGRGVDGIPHTDRYRGQLT